MELENLFEFVRKEEAILWAGAGMSLYAGFPSGNDLKKRLIDSLNTKEQAVINHELPLPSLAEEIYRLKGGNKNFLISKLKEIFINTEPKSILTHIQLAQIPHVKTIITTNYDELFEKAYGNNCQKIFSSKDIPYLNKDKTHVFKIHGDLIDPDSIILTNSDYNNFFKANSENDVLWKVVSERLASNNVIFLGYNLEDPNVSVLFDKISDELGDNRKECFFVAPSLSKPKINYLIQKNIHYIDSTGEELISKLLKNIKDQILSDFEKGDVSPDTLREFLAQREFYPEISASDNKFKLKKLDSKSDNKVGGKISFTLKETDKMLTDVLSGKRLGTIKLDKSKVVEANLWYGDLKLPNPNGDNILEFRPSPKVDTSIDIRFDNGFELTNINAKIFGATTEVKIVLTLPNAELDLNFQTENYPSLKLDFKYEHNEYCEKISEEINLFKLMNNLWSGRQFTVLTPDSKQFNHSFPAIQSIIEEAKSYQEHFQNLKDIELFFNIYFTKIKFDEITYEEFAIAKRISTIIKNGQIIEEWTDQVDMEIVRTESNIVALSKLISTKVPLVAENEGEITVSIYGKDIKLGLKTTEIMNPNFINIENVLSGETNILKITSKTNKIKSTYSKLKKANP